jgi:hypothetical protein
VSLPLYQIGLRAYRMRKFVGRRRSFADRSAYRQMHRLYDQETELTCRQLNVGDPEELAALEEKLAKLRKQLGFKK